MYHISRLSNSSTKQEKMVIPNQQKHTFAFWVPPSQLWPLFPLAVRGTGATSGRFWRRTASSRPCASCASRPGIPSTGASSCRRISRGRARCRSWYPSGAQGNCKVGIQAWAPYFETFPLDVSPRCTRQSRGVSTKSDLDYPFYLLVR